MVAATSIPGTTIVETLGRVGATHVVTVPDTNQATVLERLDTSREISVLRAASEDDALGICAGLWVTGQRPIALIQQLGIFASVNALRGLAYDLRIPLAILASLYGRDLSLPPDQSIKSSVRLCIPVLEALEIRWVLVESLADSELIAEMFNWVFDERRAGVVLLGAPTS